MFHVEQIANDDKGFVCFWGTKRGCMTGHFVCFWGDLVSRMVSSDLDMRLFGGVFPVNVRIVSVTRYHVYDEHPLQKRDSLPRNK